MADTRPCWQLQVPPSCYCWQHWPVPTPVLAVSCCSKPNRAPVVTSAVPRRPSDAVAASSSPVRYSAVSVCWSALDTDSSSRQPCCAAARSASAADCRLPYNKRTNHRIFSPTFSVCVLILTVVGRLLAKDSLQNDTKSVHKTQHRVYLTARDAVLMMCISNHQGFQWEDEYLVKLLITCNYITLSNVISI